MIGLIDADIVVFRCGFACERTGYHLIWEEDGEEKAEYFDYKKDAMTRLDEVCPGKYSREEGKDYKLWPEKQLQPLGFALHNVNTLVEGICETLKLDEMSIQMHLSPYKGHTFRKDVAVTKVYKGNRKEEHRPTYEKEIREHIEKKWDTYVAEGQEADDAIGIAATRYGDDCIIITIDKDMDTIPGHHYNWVKDEQYYVTEDEANYNLACQMLAGDSTDNIPGLPGIGIGKAAKALHGLTSYEDLMREVAYQYMAHAPVDDWKEYLIEQARLVYIRRHPGEMWLPLEEIDEWAEMTEEELTL